MFLHLELISRSIELKLICFLPIWLLFSYTALCQTGGPTQPEVQTFEPLSTTELVDPFTGDFTYNIPLLDVGGYPINLIYKSGITMDQEASWVGLGWNLNPGVINRQVRGLPDDFAGDILEKQMNIKDNETWGGTVGVDLEIFGFETDYLKIGEKIGVNYNNYRGWGYEKGLSAGLRASENSKPFLTAGLGYSSNNGVNASLGLSVSQKINASQSTAALGGNIGVDYNSRSGTVSLNLMGGFQNSWNNGAQGSGSFGTKLSFASPTYTPSFPVPMADQSYAFALKVGAEVFGTTGNPLDIAGYYSKQRLAKRSERIRAYGYLFAEKSRNASRVLHDFNREKDGNFYAKQKNLPLAYHTYDLYMVSGQGINGMFRPHRSDIGTVYDAVNSTGGLEDPNISGGLEIGSGQLFKVGGNLSVTTINRYGGIWKQGNPIQEKLLFNTSEGKGPLYEPFYFKQVGETTALQNPDQYNDWKEEAPIAVLLNGQRTSNALQAVYSNRTTNFNIGGLSNFLSKRVSRNINFSTLTAAEARVAGLEKRIFDYAPYINSRHRTQLNLEQPNVGVDISHHVSEITVTREDGVRFVYGLPTYNIVKKEVSFNISAGPDASPEVTDGLVDFSFGNDDTPENKRGKSHFFESVTTPPYAYAYRLTAMLSPDYIDLTGNGPTPDDLGTYTRFNYDRVHQHYKWRSPMGAGQAFYLEGKSADFEDDLASYLYGEKEIWYLHSIQTKNYEARFITSDREDGIAVEDASGKLPSGTNIDRLRKLDRIELYTASELRTNGRSPVPIKTVHFSYNYSLCQNVPNSIARNKGKLTLKEISITYQESDKGRFSPYRFNYNGLNPDYNQQNSDRWATFKQSDPELSNTRFPYSRQPDRQLADQEAAAWHLTDISLPNGGKLNIEYEADDYAYVQNKNAQIMVPVVGTGAGPELQAGTLSLYDGERNFSYFFFDLLKPIADDEPEKLDGYFENIEELYINAQVRIRDDRSETIREFLPLVGGAKRYGFDESSKVNNAYTRAWVQIREVEFENGGIGKNSKYRGSMVHPLAQSTWQFLNLHLPHIAYENGEFNQGDAKRLISSFLFIWDSVSDILNGINTYMKDRKYANALSSKTSFIRLNHPHSRKVGGGSRVKRIRLNDQWGKMTEREGELLDLLNFDYGQEYDYTTVNSDGQSISSGVATYEPLVGGDENPFVQPQRFKHNRLSLFQLHPFGESLFPGPSVGYSTVNIRQLKPASVVVTGNGTTVQEYYTARDFPVIVRQTDLVPGESKNRNNPFPIISPVYNRDIDEMALSQGYSIELNDMHGKPRAQWLYAEDQPEAPVSGISFQYLTEPDAPDQLKNTAPVIRQADGGGLRQEEGIIGLTYDIIFDARESLHKVKATGVDINADGFLAGIFPITIPIPYPDLAESTNRFRSIVATKVVQRSGILASVTTHDMGASITSTNRAWDALTGEVLVTEAQSEFGQSYYTMEIPAYWEYPGMGGAWQNIGAVLEQVETSADGLLPLASGSDFFFPGDELLLEYIEATGGTPGEPIQKVLKRDKAWVLEVTAEGLTLIDDIGQAIPPRVHEKIKVVRSGYRNQQSFSQGTVVTKVDPLSNGFDFKQVIDANAMEFADHWQTYAAYQVNTPGVACDNCQMIEVLPPEKIFDDRVALLMEYNTPKSSATALLYLLQDVLSQGNKLLLEEDLLPIIRSRQTGTRPLPADFEVFVLLYLQQALSGTHYADLPEDGDYIGARSKLVPIDVTQIETPFGAINYSKGGLTVSQQTFISSIKDYFIWSWDVQYAYSSLEIVIKNKITSETICSLTLRNPDGPFPPLNGISAIRNLQIDRTSPFQCGSVGDFLIDVEFTDPDDPNGIVQSLSLQGFAPCLPIADCTEGFGSKPIHSCDVVPGAAINPFRAGILGNWRPLRSWVYLSERTSGRAHQAGTFINFEPFWSSFSGHRRDNWQWESLSRVINPLGNGLESLDPLGRSRAELYGYDHNLVTAVGANTTHSALVFDGFEDYDYKNRIGEIGDCDPPRHWSFQEAIEESNIRGLKIDQEQRHTGRSSLRLPASFDRPQSVSISRSLSELCRELPSGGITNHQYLLQPCDLIPTFQPPPGKYIISAWVKDSGEELSSEGPPFISIGDQNFHPRGPVVEGWQRIFSSFDIEDTDPEIKVTLNSGKRGGWFDDIRIHPFDAQMETYVFDAQNLRLRAILDANNFATIYEYNEEGALQRTKKETERGLMTIQEINTAKPKTLAEDE
ncbi:hypothetical protein [Flavilitoribacter nigricans]|uniref:PA14 domain-containing protein n=1 Tax=Flavilitoribacter nigricans (strain ATCC 23147 / DSM 23189 / NBRC 102662 / NCIMB 1420 / SS-2) TaxID=1122177 RepID=A0A2D0N1H8_FLAN2|nr:hypothetical protein [Flavilitoribacter nigricans]PHN01989.1 hypothetical protein CRP01_34350 [Flavilitoribacter nigricans DSM 23189 = NBRC 102662]